jgi:2,4-didehydro-3-deoxy-L-rhamnonate hydrolase
MKLARYGRAGKEKPALVDGNGKLRDLSEVVTDIDAGVLGPRSLARLAKLKPESLPTVRGTPRIGPCLAQVGNFIAVGLNYADHEVMIPKGSKKTDWEVELAIVIGTRASYVSESQALSHVAGFCVCNDVSEREFQLERSGQWVKGKSAPTFGPLGPWLVTPDEIKDVQGLGMWLDVNGERMQTGSTKTMVFGVKTLISYISQFMILEPGDVITTGTPPGVGSGMKPQRFLKAGDTMSLGIDGLGQQAQQVVAWKAG